jgi:hypothetical protein
MCEPMMPKCTILIDTPLQRGGCVQLREWNRFSGFCAVGLGIRCWKPLKRLTGHCSQRSPR